MSSASPSLTGGWLRDADGLVANTRGLNASSPSPSEAPAPPELAVASTPGDLATPYGVTAQQLDALSAVAYLVGSPLQRQQPAGSDMTHPALLVAAKLLQQGVDPERIIELIECRYTDAS